MVKSQYRVQKLVTVRRPTASGAADTKVGQWTTIAVKSTRATAEHFAKHAQIDNPNSQIRVEEHSS